MSEIRRDYIYTDTMHWMAGTNIWVIPPGGYLIAVTAEVQRPRIIPAGCDKDKPTRVNITDCQGTVLDKFDVEWAWGWHEGGVLLEKPLLNVSSVTPYRIETPEASPALIVRFLSCGLMPR